MLSLPRCVLFGDILYEFMLIMALVCSHLLYDVAVNVTKAAFLMPYALVLVHR